jgi:redox-sensitive bicupin YhaK (pirin superfamily)
MTAQTDSKKPSVRRVSRVIKGMPASDGAGVHLTRVIGQPALPMLDPFLLLDAFRSDKPEDYLAGVPPHPHRGFETVTYLLEGRMRHQDNAGHEGVIEPGGIQWMTAGKGIVHSEMPEQENGLLEGFQLWVNLPATHKMDPPTYQEYPVSHIPLETRDGTRHYRHHVAGHAWPGGTTVDRSALSGCEAAGRRRVRRKHAPRTQCLCVRN